MEDKPEIPADWTGPEQWVWQQIASGESADLRARGIDQTNLDPRSDKGWGDDRRLSSEFLRTILTQKSFVETTPFNGVHILGALIDDAPLHLEHARLQRRFWLETSRILIDFNCSNLRVDGELSLNECFFARAIDLSKADIRESTYLSGSTFERNVRLDSATVSGSAFLCNRAIFKGGLNLESTKIGSTLYMNSSTFAGTVNLSRITVDGAAFLHDRAIFKGELNLLWATIGANLVMDKSTFEGNVSLGGATLSGNAFLGNGATFKRNLSLVGAKIGKDLVMKGSKFERGVQLRSVTVSGSAHLSESAIFEGDVDLTHATVDSAVFLHNRATFKRKLNLLWAKIGANLVMDHSTFEGDVSLGGATVGGNAYLRWGANFKGNLNLVGAKIDRNLEMNGSKFEGDVRLIRATVHGAAFLHNSAIFKGTLNLESAKIGLNLAMHGSTFEGAVDLSRCTVAGNFLLGISGPTLARWGNKASLTLRNTHVGALQGWWRDDNASAWPETYQLEGFTYDRLSSIDVENEAYLPDRAVRPYIKWLEHDPWSSPQPYEHLADRFHEAGEPHMGTDILYAARERQRRNAYSTVDEYDYPKTREWSRALGLWALRVTIGYGLGNRYFRALWWVGGSTLLGAFVLIFFGTHSLEQLPRILFASFDQLLPIVTLDNAHDALIFGDPHFKPRQPYGVLVYFYVHKIAGWIFGLFLVAGFSGLTQRN